MKSLHTLALIASLVLLAACGKDQPAPAVDTASTAAAEAAKQQAANSAAAVAPKPEQLPVEVRADAIAAGDAVGDNGAVSSAKTSYSVGDTVYASMPVRGHAAGAEAGVYWTYQDGNTHKEERKPIPAGAEFMNFQFSRADGMKPGKYNVQIDVDLKPVGIVDFKVD